MADDATANELLNALRALAKELSESHDWLDIDELEDDESFVSLVELLADPTQVADDTFATLAGDRSAWVRAAVLGAIAAGRRGPPKWQDRAVKRFPRAEWGERCFTLQALAHASFPAIPLVLPLVEDDMSGTPMAQKMAEFLDVRAAQGERVTAARLSHVDVSRQAIIAEILSATEPETQDALRPTFEEWQLAGIDVDFFRELGRVVDVASRPPATLVGSRGSAVDAIAAALSGPRPRSLLLVGEPGVGKTTLITESLRRLGTDWFAFQAGAAELLAGQSYIGELEGRVRDVVSRLHKRRIVWVFPSFEDALWSGQHSQSPRGALDALLPHVEAGDAILVGEIDPLAYDLVLQNRPRVGRLFEVVRLAPLVAADAIAVARDWARHTGVDVDDETLAEALDLATHYLPATASPGNVLRLLDLVRARVERGAADAVTPGTVISTLSEATGLPLHVLDPRAPLDLDEVRAHFTARVLGQPEAVECLVERIALIKAGLTDPTRPLGVFLFVGPTGTGKTEIAKAFSEFVFGSADRLIRLDMTEYQTIDSLDRLLGDATSPEKAASPLIAEVRKQPFSVLLLDEFEKAHAQVWDVFLQVFDDGRLTDRNGRTVDLRHCVIILTSNLGSSIPAGPGIGFVDRSGAFSAGSVLKHVERTFRPEFLNRFDRVVVFRPLGRDIMRGLLEKELTDMLERRGFRMQPWAVEWDEAAVDYLIEQGFSASLGARPLKRAVERHLLTKIATAIVERKFPEGDQFLFITAREGTGLDVTFVDPNAEQAPTVAAAPTTSAELTLASVALDPDGSAAEAAFLRAELAEVVERVRSWDAAKYDALEAARDPAFWESDERNSVLGLVEYLDRLGAATATAERLGARLSSGREAHSRKLVQLLARRLHVLTAALAGLDVREASDATVKVRPGHADDEKACEGFVQELAAMYVGWADGRGMRARRNGADGVVVLEITGLGAYTLLKAESGLHVLELPGGDERAQRAFERVTALVDVEPAAAGGGAQRMEGRAEPGIVRRYRREPSPLVRDAAGARTGRLDLVLAGDFDLFAAAATDD